MLIAQLRLDKAMRPLGAFNIGFGAALICMKQHMNVRVSIFVLLRHTKESHGTAVMPNPLEEFCHRLHGALSTHLTR